MIRARYGAISRRKTSLPPPGLECVVSITTLFGYFVCACGRATKAVAATSTSAIWRMGKYSPASEIAEEAAATGSQRSNEGTELNGRNNWRGCGAATPVTPGL